MHDSQFWQKEAKLVMFSKAAFEASNPSTRDTSILEIHAVADLVCYRRRQPPLARLFGFLRRQLERLRFRFFGVRREPLADLMASVKALETRFRGGAEDRQSVMHPCSSSFLSFWVSLRSRPMLRF